MFKERLARRGPFGLIDPLTNSACIIGMSDATADTACPRCVATLGAARVSARISDLDGRRYVFCSSCMSILAVLARRPSLPPSDSNTNTNHTNKLKPAIAVPYTRPTWFSPLVDM